MELNGFLPLFCGHLVKKYGDPRSVSEDLKAEEFRSYFLNDHPVNVRSLRLVACVCGFNTEAIESGKMPKTMRGYHELIGNRKNIYYREEDSQSGIQNTILHEIREMMEPMFVEVFPAYKPLNTRAPHMAANRFASAVLLPKNDFMESIYQTGFDVAALSKIYSKSYSQIVLRMGEVLQEKLFFYGALYEKEDQESLQWKITYWIQSLNRNEPGGKALGITSIFPRKGRSAAPGSLIESSVQTAKSHLGEYIVERKGLEAVKLVSLANPLFVAESVYKVALVTLLIDDVAYLKPQIERNNPIVLKTIHLKL